ncbi:DUF6544 family protein, partial [Saliniramus sp.]|uniref:DUF6544 family protein n=1 Tax=Saliniramus sp. TaxID=2986772 RepID=UPI002C4C87A7
MKLVLAILLMLAAAVLGLLLLKLLDRNADRTAWQRLAALQPSAPVAFHDGMIDGLPEPAQRYFRFMIRSGTPILPVAEIAMRGQF